MTKLKKLFRFALVATGIVATASSASAEVTCERAVLNSGDTAKLVGGVYTAASTTEKGGVFYVSGGATLMGTNVTFASNAAVGEGGAIYNKGKLALDGAVFSDNVSENDGGALSTGGEATFTDEATFERNSGLYGGAIANSGVMTFAASATFADNKATGGMNAGGAIENFGGTLTLKDAATFAGNSADAGGAIYNENGSDYGKTGVITFAKGATFSGNAATTGNGGAIYNDATISFSGLMDLQTAGDTWYNAANSTINWDLTGGLEQYGSISHFEWYANADGTVKQLVSVKDNQPAGDYIIATGDFAETIGKDTFSITNISGGAAMTIKIDGDTVVSTDGFTGYTLLTEPAGEITNLVLQIVKYTCERTSLKTGQSTNLVNGFTYTAPSAAKNGGVFYLNPGATLMGTNVTFASNKTTSSGAAIYNNGTVALKDAVFTGNQAYTGGALYNMKTAMLEDVTFNGNEATAAGGAIYNSGTATLNLDGPVTLVTSTDTFYSKGTINWNLTGGKAGRLNGYEKFTNDLGDGGKLKLTVESYKDLPKDFVIATGDLSGVMGKDTFSITNISGGAEISITIDAGEVTDGDTYYQLVQEPAGETTHLVLKVYQPTEPIVTAPIASVGNATLAVYTNGFLSTETSTPGVWNAWSNKIAMVVYTANEGYCFANGETVVTNKLDTKVNPAVVKEGEVVPGTAGKTTLKFGIVAQRYPWNGIVDVNYKATYWPAGKPGAVEIKLGENVTTNEFVITGFGSVLGTAAVQMPAEMKGQATFKAVVK